MNYRDKIKKMIIFLLIIISLPISVIMASSSSDYELDPQNNENSGGVDSNSNDYFVNCQQIGDTAIGESDSADYQIQHGFICSRASTTIDFTCLPDNRYLAFGDNYENKVTIEVRPVGGDIFSIIFSQEVTTDVHGNYTGLVLNGVSSGNYDITCKGWNTLRLKESNITLNNGTVVDFSHSGTKLALAGDLNNSNEGNRVSSAEQGDNDISAADYSDLVANYNNTPGPSEDRRDLDNWGGNATAADYSIVVFNYNSVGE